MNERRDTQEEEGQKRQERSRPWDMKGGRTLKPTRVPSLKETGHANRITVSFQVSGVPVDKNSTGGGNTFTYTGTTFHIHKKIHRTRHPSAPD